MIIIILSIVLQKYLHFIAIDTTPSGKRMNILSTVVASGLAQRLASRGLSVRLNDEIKE